MQQIERGIYLEDTYLGVTLGGLVFSHGTILIDAPLRAEDARTWRSSLMSQRGGVNRLLINLDAHPDRTLGVRALDCTVVAHQKTAQVFRNRPTIFKGQNIESGSAWEEYSDAIGMRWASPDITFSQSLTLNWGGPEVLLEHHPGPTAGSTWAVIPSAKVVFVGDTVVSHQPPFIASADLRAWLESLQQLKKSYGDYVVVAGRGGVAHPEDLQILTTFLLTVQEKMEQLSKRSAASEEIHELLPSLLAMFSFRQELKSLYEQRLRYGLLHYYARYYRQSGSVELQHMEDDEQ